MTTDFESLKNKIEDVLIHLETPEHINSFYYKMCNANANFSQKNAVIAATFDAADMAIRRTKPDAAWALLEKTPDHIIMQPRKHFVDKAILVGQMFLDNFQPEKTKQVTIFCHEKCDQYDIQKHKDLILKLENKTREFVKNTGDDNFEQVLDQQVTETSKSTKKKFKKAVIS